ncbi:hypothetical protein ANN_23684 [Periplaneta americana]|uniref:Uncharacterized protein n=1 Tax=Periplaneta americana TaxID=6978 RepID=A0ABQ8SMP8_PERAM|nr:hypothetical protein ANN_23684 [Periplaneta americana]
MDCHSELRETLGDSVLEHITYSSDLSPYDFDLIPQLKKLLRGKQFSNREDILTAEIFNAYIIVGKDVWKSWGIILKGVSFLLARSLKFTVSRTQDLQRQSTELRTQVSQLRSTALKLRTSDAHTAADTLKSNFGLEAGFTATQDWLACCPTTTTKLLKFTRLSLLDDSVRGGPPLPLSLRHVRETACRLLSSPLYATAYAPGSRCARTSLAAPNYGRPCPPSAGRSKPSRPSCSILLADKVVVGDFSGFSRFLILGICIKVRTHLANEQRTNDKRLHSLIEIGTCVRRSTGKPIVWFAFGSDPSLVGTSKEVGIRCGRDLPLACMIDSFNIFLTAAVLSILLIIGNVELNPGPGSREGRDNSDEVFQREWINYMKETREDRQKASVLLNKVSNDLDTLVNRYNEVENKLKEVIQEQVVLKAIVKRWEIESRRNNIVFYGVEEENYEKGSDTCFVVLDLLTKFFRLNLDVSAINNAYRVGRGKNRPIVVKLNSYFIKEHIMANTNQLKGSKIYIENDFSKEIREKRKKLVPLLKEARFKGFKASLVNDKIKINGNIVDLEFLKDKNIEDVLSSCKIIEIRKWRQIEIDHPLHITQTEEEVGHEVENLEA